MHTLPIAPETTTVHNARPTAGAPTPVLTFQAEGRRAEIVIDTGFPLSEGRSWRAFAKVFCHDVYTARLVADGLKRRIAEAVSDARRQAYAAGRADVLAGKPPREHFSGQL